MALEVMLCHWDGYCMNQNNWRIFHDLGANKMVFIAHGWIKCSAPEQCCWQVSKAAECPIYPPIHGAVAEAVMDTAVGRKLYLERQASFTQYFSRGCAFEKVDEPA
jgi:hypothetical protein